MLLIGENIHIISKVVSQAVAARNEKVLQQMAKEQADMGMDYIDLNVGPARKSPEVMGWVVQVIQEAVDVPLVLDSTNPDAIEAGLKMAQRSALINSASGKQESKERVFPLAAKYDCEVIVSVLNDQGIPADAKARAESIMETVAYGNELGIANERMWIDPILLPVIVSQQGALACLEFTQMLPDLVPGVKSTIGLSNISSGVPREFRGILNRAYLLMLSRYGLHSAIVDAYDTELRDLVQGKMRQIVELIHKVMDGEDVDMSALPPKERDYVKTARVLVGEVIYSHTWLKT